MYRAFENTFRRNTRFATSIPSNKCWRFSHSPAIFGSDGKRIVLIKAQDSTMGRALSAWLDSGRFNSVVMAGAAALLAAAAVSLDINHDESQYVAAIALMRTGIPFADFAYLQTPLQPLLLAPLSALPAGWLLFGSRAANVVFILIAVGAVLFGLRRGAPNWAAAVGAAALVTTDAVLRCGAVARNDALPLALLASGLALLLPRVNGTLSKKRAALVFLFFGLAISAKVSMALPAAGAGLFILLKVRTLGWGVAGAAFLGGCIGLLPCIVLYLTDPARFLFGVFAYSLEAPQQWWAAVGQGERLDGLEKLQKLASLAKRGAMPLALVAALIDRQSTADRLLLDLMIIGGLLAAYLPDPAFPQYLIPVTAPLFMRLTLAMANFGRAKQTGMLAGLAVLSIMGMSRTATAARDAFIEEPELFSAMRQARVIAAAADGGRVVTLSPERASGANINLDRRFVTGPFLFRTHGELSGDALALGYSPNWQRLSHLDRAPPRVIVTGAEREARPPLHPAGLDAHLDRWAQERGYAHRPLGEGYILWSAPELSRL